MGCCSVIGIDPGKRTGVAVFSEGVLVEAFVWPEGRILSQDLPTDFLAPAVAVIEVPRIYPRGGKGDPNQLIDLAVLVGDLRGFYRRAGLETVLVTPRTWKGAVPKAIHNERVLGALTASEKEVLPTRPRAGGYDHNMIDAVGLALWQLERKGNR